MPVATYCLVALDCPDPKALAAFYAGILGGHVTNDGEDWYDLYAPGGHRIAFQRAPGLTLPTGRAPTTTPSSSTWTSTYRTWRRHTSWCSTSAGPRSTWTTATANEVSGCTRTRRATRSASAASDSATPITPPEPQVRRTV